MFSAPKLWLPKRRHCRVPPLSEQLAALKAFAKESGCKIAILSQLDRKVDIAPNQCPAVSSVRLPNPVDLSVFNKVLFLYRKIAGSQSSHVAMVHPKLHEFELKIEVKPLRLVEK